MTAESSDALDPLWQTHDRQWRDPTAVLKPWSGIRTDPRVLRFRASGGWWETLGRLQITLIATREYEHLVVAMTVDDDGRPSVSHLPLPHPSGLAIDRERAVVQIASTRNPNQLFEFRPLTRTLPRGDVPKPDTSERPLMPLRSTLYPGALYMHDLAYIGGVLHANAVGQNAIVRLPAGGGHELVWWPRAIERRKRPDFSRNWIQLNSIAAGADVASSYFTASAETISSRRPGHRNFPVDGRGVVFSGATREPIVRGLTRPHSARLHGGEVWVDNSGYGEVGVARDGRFEAVRRLAGWTRGLSFCDDVAFVGTSRVIPRFRRYAPGLDVDKSSCGLHAIAIPSGALLGSLTWPYGNQIFALDWLQRSQSGGMPMSGRGAARRLNDLFYCFDDTQGDHAR